MSKTFAYLYLFALLLVACDKDDVERNTPPLAKKCRITSQSGFISADNEYGVGFKTNYLADGKVSSVTAAILGHYGCVDTFRYLFRYIDDQHIRVTNARKNTCSEDSTSIEDYPGTDSADITLNAMGFIDEVLEYGIFVVVGDSTFLSVTHYNYDAQNRLAFLSYAWDNYRYHFEYDEKGNLLKMGGTADHSSFDVQYSYDYTKEANNQLYITTGWSPSWYYNLGQITGWLPVQHKNICTSQWFYKDGGQFEDQFGITNHGIDSNGNLVSFDILSADLGLTQTIHNTLDCSH